MQDKREINTGSSYKFMKSDQSVKTKKSEKQVARQIELLMGI